MISTTTNYSKIIVIQVLIIIIPFIICDKPIDYDLPLVDESNDYDRYHFRQYNRFEQSKLDPHQFFLSIYSQSYRVLPNPNVRDYESYKNDLNKSVNSINLQDIESWYDKYISDEMSGAYDNEQFLPENPQYLANTHVKYKGSAIFKEEYELAKKYLDSLGKQDEDNLATDEKEDGNVVAKPMTSDEFMEVMAFYELLPKNYEKGDEFVEARVELGRIIASSFPETQRKEKFKKEYELKDIKYNTELVDLCVEDVHIKNENYTRYSLRMMYLGKVPFSPIICNELYGTEHAVDADLQYTDLKMDLTGKKKT